VVLGWYKSLDGDWRATAYVALARALGFSTNGEPMEMLARITPLANLLRHSDSPELLEAALMGLAVCIAPSGRCFRDINFRWSACQPFCP